MKRATCTVKRVFAFKLFHPPKNGEIALWPYFVKRDLHIVKRDLHIVKRATCTAKRFFAFRTFDPPKNGEIALCTLAVHERVDSRIDVRIDRIST